MAFRGHYAKVRGYIDTAEQSGGRLLAGREPISGAGLFVAPTERVGEGDERTGEDAGDPGDGPGAAGPGEVAELDVVARVDDEAGCRPDVLQDPGHRSRARAPGSRRRAGRA